MSGISWSELFPSRNSYFIFIGYMSLFVSQGILVTSSQDSNNSYSYNTVTVVLITEIVKLIVSSLLYCYNHSWKSLIISIIKGKYILLLYFVPAFLYCLYNNLAFINLSVFDPTTYYLLLQFRVVITGVLFQIIFNKYLSKKQWFSLILLTIGCMIKQTNIGKPLDTQQSNEMTQIQIDNDNKEKSFISFDININAIFILIQTICSCLAGVYNEYLLKDKGANVNIYIQNVFMYLDSIICNIILIIMQGNLLNTFQFNNIQSLFRLNVLLIIINNTAIGIVTSFFLKYMNSILKTFASALELMFTAILCYILFAIPIYLNTILSIFIVSLAVYLYSQCPVVNLNQNNKISSTNDTRKLLDDHDKKIEEV